MPDPAADQTLLGFDVGTRRIGVALANTVTRVARPLAVIPAEPVAPRFAQIHALLTEWQARTVVVGLALTADGGEQPATGRCRRFADQLRGRFGVVVHLQDERDSSLEAQAILGRGGDDDAMAAAVILQRYLDAL